MNEKPQWVRDREAADEAMGEMRSGASFGDLLGVSLGLAIERAFLVAIAVVIYLVGRAVVG